MAKWMYNPGELLPKRTALQKVNRSIAFHENVGNYTFADVLREKRNIIQNSTNERLFLSEALQ